MSQKTLQCSFCGKSQAEVARLVAGPSVNICNECVDICAEIIGDDAAYERHLTHTVGTCLTRALEDLEAARILAAHSHRRAAFGLACASVNSSLIAYERARDIYVSPEYEELLKSLVGYDEGLRAQVGPNVAVLLKDPLSGEGVTDFELESVLDAAHRIYDYVSLHDAA